MTPTVEKPKKRVYHLKFDDGAEVEVHADILCEPGENNPKLRLKRDGEIVAEYEKAKVIGWRISESDPDK